MTSVIGRPLVWIWANSPGLGVSVIVFCRLPISETTPPMKLAYMPASRAMRHARSEERRVGKECRSLCDWSSDVCSSDLRLRRQCHRFLSAADLRNNAAHEIGVHAGIEGHAPCEIGRASCRERV